MNIDKCHTIKVLGSGLYGVTYMVEYNNEYYALKIEKVLKKDLAKKKNLKKPIWRELQFYEDNKNNKFIAKLHSWDTIKNCDLQRTYPIDINQFNETLQAYLTKLDKSDICVRKLMELAPIPLYYNDNIKRTYSILFRIIMGLNSLKKYVHGDIHEGNIMLQRTNKKVLHGVPSHGVEIKLIDFGSVLHEDFPLNKGDKDYYNYLIDWEHVNVLYTCVQNNFWNNMQTKITNSATKDMAIFREMKEYKIILKKYKSDDEYTILRILEILYPEKYQRLVLKKKFKKVVHSEYSIPKEELVKCLTLSKKELIKYLKHKAST